MIKRELNIYAEERPLEWGGGDYAQKRIKTLKKAVLVGEYVTNLHIT